MSKCSRTPKNHIIKHLRDWNIQPDRCIMSKCSRTPKNHIIKHLREWNIQPDLEREMEFNGLKAEELSVKTQIVVTKKEQRVDKPNRKQNEKI